MEIVKNVKIIIVNLENRGLFEPRFFAGILHLFNL